MEILPLTPSPHQNGKTPQAGVCVGGCGSRPEGTQAALRTCRVLRVPYTALSTQAQPPAQERKKGQAGNAGTTESFPVWRLSPCCLDRMG